MRNRDIAEVHTLKDLIFLRLVDHFVKWIEIEAFWEMAPTIDSVLVSISIIAVTICNDLFDDFLVEAFDSERRW